MAIYYVRKGGSDSNNGLSAGAAWLTIGKALGASGISSGDTVYIGAGVYREVSTVSMVSPTVETKFIGDVTGEHTGDAGIVRWTGFLTNDKSSSSNSILLDLNSRSFLTFQNIYFCRAGTIVSSGASAATNIKFSSCVFFQQGPSTAISKTVPHGQSAQWIIEDCILFARVQAILITLILGTVDDYDANIVIRNCRFIGISGSPSISAQAQGTGDKYGGGITVTNCTRTGGTGPFINGAGASVIYPIYVYNCIAWTNTGTTLLANVEGQIVEDYNYFLANVIRSNTAVGANTLSGESFSLHHHMGETFMWGMTPRPETMPMDDSPLLGFGAAGSPTVSTDALGIPRPSGGGSNLKAIGWLERSNTAVRETSTVRTGLNALRITGPGVQDFDIPVDAVATTISIYTRWDGTYTGSKPQIHLINGTGCGVVDASDIATGSSGSWEELSLTFTPTSKGIVTIRLQSNDTNGAGQTYWDDLTVT
jgi:hypothetical protein